MSQNGVSNNTNINTSAVRATLETKKSILSNTSSSVMIPNGDNFVSNSPKASFPTKDSTRTSQNLLHYEVTLPKPTGMTEAEKKVSLID